MRSKSILPIAFLFTICIIASSMNPHASPYVTATPRPQAAFTPPPSLTGTGYSITLVDSVNAWQARSPFVVKNDYTTCQKDSYRNATFMQGTPTGFTLAWQNLTVSMMRAVPDSREVQYALSSTGYLDLSKGGSTVFSAAAMRFILPDTVNLTSVWLHYNSSATSPLSQLQVVSKGTVPDSTPQGGTIIGTTPLPSQSGVPDWHEVVLSTPLNLTKNRYYWIAINASSVAGKHVLWSFVKDQGGVPDQKLAAAYSSTWVGEGILNSSYAKPYLNLLLVLKVLPVANNNPSRVMTYSSPSQVNMRELTSGVAILRNTTRIPAATHRFFLSTNTSVSFTLNWTARFEKFPRSLVATSYTVQSGLPTSWIANFTSAGRPASPVYPWYNRTLTITSIPLDWQINPVGNVTNDGNINYTASYAIGSGYMTIRQIDNLTAPSTVWYANWGISATSPYLISASAPLQVVMEQQFNINIGTPSSNTHCNITLYDSTDSVIFNRIISLPVASTYSFPIRLNQTGDFTIALFDSADYAPEACYLLMPMIQSVQAQTSLDLQSSALRASWGDIVTITFRYMNTTLGSNKEFPNPPTVELVTSSGNFTIKNVQATGGGWFSFNFETRFLPSSGAYILTIMISYEGSYLNQKTMTLQLDPPGISPVMVVLAGGGSAGAVIAVVVARKYFATRKSKEEEKVKILRQTTSLAQLVVVHLGSGRAAYSRNLGTEESVDPNLIGGFLAANQSIMSQVFKGKAPSGLKFADYGEFKVISHVGKLIMASLFCTEAAGEELKTQLEKFTEEFESRYEKELSAWDGNLDVFKGADSMADRVFSLRLISPYILVLERLARVKLSGIEKAVVDSARRLSATRGIFFMPRIIDFLLTSKKVKRSKIVDIIDSLVKKGVFKQLTIDEAAQIISLTEYSSGTGDDAIGDLLDNGK
jgi:hypothetical protein